MIDPWGSNQYFDYEKLMKEFGISAPDNFFDHYLFRRHLIFGQRSIDYIEYAIKNRIKFNAVTGLMPSGAMHLGNKITIDQIIFFQGLGADVFISVADLESYATRNIGFERAREIAINNYIVNYISLGLKPCRIYFQSEDKDTQRLAFILSNETNMTELKAIYGLNDSSSMLHVNSPLIQAADVLHSQLKKFGGPRPTIVPVGVDQDPHIRLMRDLASRLRVYSVSIKDGYVLISIKGTMDSRKFIDDAVSLLNNYDASYNYDYRTIELKNSTENDKIEIDLKLSLLESKYNDLDFIAPSATFQKLETGLKGGKMSSHVPDSLISLNDDESDARRKIKSSLTGGRKTIEDQKIYGGNPERCPVYELYLYHDKDDKNVQRVYEECRGGVRMCGACKNEASEMISRLLNELKEKKDESLSKIDEYLSHE
ncbi:tryptophan--tRNA ligase [Picrophilus oshimae]|uniref:Tryptophan--tRNA ligase n=1 Tax=Picrophilus torridus (strain ATCC 700027 / DSM 9790 / JCM 10055 / NBRC 100828 / KAW 2/3) TaxID=1122961 RepID=A0A8G2FY05_PICTO|nr:tryptophan--tRNA ligase [Picrophilus oshimae]SMD31607.1 tryptophanyl-tRNA synthetase [Picrophilus oshimae DSM 9789]